jgi:hypothetical protein
VLPGKVRSWTMITIRSILDEMGKFTLDQSPSVQAAAAEHRKKSRTRQTRAWGHVGGAIWKQIDNHPMS